MKPDASNFRRWLIERLSESRWPVYVDDTDEAIAKRIGVQLDVLLEARQLFQARTVTDRSPQGQRLGMPRSSVERVPLPVKPRLMVFLEPPKAVYEEYMAICKHRDLTKSALLRSVCHYILQLKAQPAWLSQKRGQAAWIFRGKWLPQKDIRAHRYRVKCDLNDAAFRALEIRAQRTGCTTGALARWGVCLLVAAKLPNIPIVGSLLALYKEPSLYCLDPKITR